MSVDVLQMITGVILIDLMVLERQIIHKGAKGEESTGHQRVRAKTMERCQVRRTDNRRRVKGVFLRDLMTRVKSHRIDYFVTQFLMAHGSFVKNTYQIQKTAN